MSAALSGRYLTTDKRCTFEPAFTPLARLDLTTVLDIRQGLGQLVDASIEPFTQILRIELWMDRMSLPVLLAGLMMPSELVGNDSVVIDFTAI